MGHQLSIAVMSARGMLFWFAHITDPFTQRNVFELMEKEGQSTPDTKAITHQGKQVVGYHVTHSAFEWLSKNRNDIPPFRLFHSKFRDGEWAEFTPDKSPTKGLENSSPAEVKQLREELARIRGKRGLVEKPATMFKQRYKKKK